MKKSLIATVLPNTDRTATLPNDDLFIELSLFEMFVCSLHRFWTGLQLRGGVDECVGGGGGGGGD